MFEQLRKGLGKDEASLVAVRTQPAQDAPLRNVIIRSKWLKMGLFGDEPLVRRSRSLGHPVTHGIDHRPKAVHLTDFDHLQRGHALERWIPFVQPGRNTLGLHQICQGI